MAKKVSKGHKADASESRQFSAPVSGGEVKVGDKVYKAKLVTLPHRKFADGVMHSVKITAPMRDGSPDIDRKTGKVKLDENGQPRKPAKVLTCADLATGEMFTLIAGTVLEQRLNENYPDAGYVGRAYQFTQHKVEGKRWRDYSITELEA